MIPPFTDQLGNYFNVVKPQIIDNEPKAAGQPYFIRQGNCSESVRGQWFGQPAIPFTWASTPIVCNNGKESNALYKTRYNDFAPRIGIAYAFDSKTVIRAAYGVFYMQDVGNSMYFDMARNIGVRLTLTANTGQATWATAGTVQGLPSTWANAVTAAGRQRQDRLSRRLTPMMAVQPLHIVYRAVPVQCPAATECELGS